MRTGRKARRTRGGRWDSVADYSRELASIRAAVAEAKELAEAFQTGTAKFYEKGNSTPVLTCTVRVKKPRPSAFDAGNQTEWATKRNLVLRVPMDATTGVIRKGLIVQVYTPDGDPTINQINFTVLSALKSSFAAEREVTVTTEVDARPRIS